MMAGDTNLLIYCIEPIRSSTAEHSMSFREPRFGHGRCPLRVSTSFWQ
jgi:hypothetical protein